MTHSIRSLINEPGITMTPGIHDVLSARVAADAGFQAIWVGGFAVSASILGLPDANVLTLDEQVAVTRAIAGTVDVPLIVDADNGYGNAINVRLRTVRELEAAGASAIVLEDQVVPKRCGLYPGQRPIVPAEEHAGKIAAAVEARANPETVIVARTDAFSAGYDVDEALSRASMYVEAGADAVLPISKHFENLHNFATGWDHTKAPLITAPTLFPEKTLDEIGALGFKLMIPPLMTMASAIWAMKAAMRHLRENNRPGGFEHMVPFEELLETVRLADVVEMESRFVPGGSTLVGA